MRCFKGRYLAKYQLFFEFVYLRNIISHVYENSTCLRAATIGKIQINPLKPELNPICYLLALLGAHHFLHVSRIRVKSLTLR